MSPARGENIQNSELSKKGNSNIKNIFGWKTPGDKILVSSAHIFDILSRKTNFLKILDSK